MPTFQHFPWAKHSLDHSGAIAGLGPTQSFEEDSISIYLYRCYGSIRMSPKTSDWKAAAGPFPWKDPSPWKKPQLLDPIFERLLAHKASDLTN